MTLLQLPQIGGVIASYVSVLAFTANGGDDDVTADLTSALTTAGRTGETAPSLAVSSGENGVGVIVTGANNKVEVFSNLTKNKVKDLTGNEVYGRITENTGDYTITYFVLDDGTETAHSFGSATDIDLYVPYRFTIASFPGDSLLRIFQNPQQDVTGSSGLWESEELAIATLNTVPDLTKTPIGEVDLVVNGKVESSAASPAPFTVTGKAIAWSATNAGYGLRTTYEVVAKYFTNE